MGHMVKVDVYKKLFSMVAILFTAFPSVCRRIQGALAILISLSVFSNVRIFVFVLEVF